jgi:S-DNA-T family DNA segregation ATPase FtsK/SpoIIIE
MNLQDDFIQIGISIAVVAFYHFLIASRKKPAESRADTDPSRSGASSERRHLPEPPPAPVAPALTAPPAPIAPVISTAPLPIAATVAAPPPPTVPASAETPPEILAVIAAAIAVVIGKAHRVVAVQQTVPTPQMNVWALEGRVEQFMSHRVR